MANNNNKRRRFNPPTREVQGDKEVLARPIDSLGLPDETLELLKNNKFNTVLDLAKRTERDMFRVQTFNKKHLGTVKNAMKGIGVDFLPFIPKEQAEASTSVPTNDTQKQTAQNNIRQQQGSKQQQGNNDRRHGQNNGKQQNQPNNQQSKQQQGGGKQQQNNNTRPQPQQRQPEPKKPKVELPLEEWQKVSKNGKYGFSNGLMTVIQPQFDEVFCFKEGLACVDVGDKFGYIDQKGDFVIIPQYECAMSFSEGMAVFFEGEKCGYINKTGEIVIPAKFDAATAFENGRAKVKEAGKWQTIDPEGNILWSK